MQSSSEKAGTSDSRVGGHLHQLVIGAVDPILLTAGYAAVLGRDVLDREDTVARGVLLEGAATAIQHDGVRVSI